MNILQTIENQMFSAENHNELLETYYNLKSDIIADTSFSCNDNVIDFLFTIYCRALRKLVSFKDNIIKPKSKTGKLNECVLCRKEKDLIHIKSKYFNIVKNPFQKNRHLNKSMSWICFNCLKFHMNEAGKKHFQTNTYKQQFYRRIMMLYR